VPVARFRGSALRNPVFAIVAIASTVLAATLISAGTGAAAVAAHLVAPKPTSTAASPEAPDPHPPLGGVAPDGTVPGGPLLDHRDVIVAHGAPKLPKNLTAQSWILVDLDSGSVLAARDPHGRYQPASIQKIMTAVTLLPKLPGNKVVTVSPAAANTEGSAVGLLAGARYTVDELFAALILVSGNDAAQALAEANGGVAKTVSQVNAEAQTLGAYDTVVQTASGLDGWQQLTSAYDMALFLRAAVNDARFVQYDQLRSASFPAKASKYGKVGGYEFDNQSLNFFDTVPGALIAKTGYTDAALHTYACATDRHGKRLGVIFLRAQRTPIDQFQQAAELLNWGYALRPGTPSVGTLAGPIPAATDSQGPAQSTSPSSDDQSPATGTHNDAAPLLSPSRSGSTAIDAPPALPPNNDSAASRTQSARRFRAANSAVTAAVAVALIVAVAGVTTWRRRTRRSRP
jgi:serine-type D-Ala-D-Ala carboxypeptidase (penicillin-binding protein 5/6)